MTCRIQTFLNACGWRDQVAGRIQGLVLSTGDLSMRLSPFVSQALNYELLLATDFLYPALANISYYQQRLENTTDGNARASIPIHFM